MRITAANQLLERAATAKADVVTAVRGVMTPDKPARQRVHGLWSLLRLDSLDDDLLARSMADPDRELRVHGLKSLIERRTSPQRCTRSP